MTTHAKIAWRNIWRNPRRSLVTISAIVFASILLIFSISFQFNSYKIMIDAAVGTHTGHLQVQAEGYNEDKKMHQVVRNPDKVAEAFKDLSWIKALSYRADTFSLVSSQERTYGVWVVGIDPAREKQVSTLSKVIREGDALSETDSRHALIGTLLAKNLAAKVGDELVLLGQGLDGSVSADLLNVKGIFSTGQPELDRSFLQMPLTTFQEIFSMGDTVHQIVVVGKDLDLVSEAAQAIQQRLEAHVPSQKLKVLTWRQLLPGLEQSIEVDMVSGWIFYGILVIIVAFSIMNTFLMTVVERTREFGMLLAIGMRHGQIVRLVLMESALITAVGIGLGILFGCLITYYFQIHGIEIPGSEELLAQWGIPSRMRPKLTPFSVSLGPVLILAITLLTAIFPVLRIYRLEPIRAMRSV